MLLDFIFKGHHLELLRCQISQKYDVDLKNYNELHEWSVQNYDQFWGHLWAYFDVRASCQPEQVVDTAIRMDSIPKWFVGARMNYAENLLRYSDDDKVALYYTSER